MTRIGIPSQASFPVNRAIRSIRGFRGPGLLRRKPLETTVQTHIE